MILCRLDHVVRIEITEQQLKKTKQNATLHSFFRVTNTETQELAHYLFLYFCGWNKHTCTIEKRLGIEM